MYTMHVDDAGLRDFLIDTGMLTRRQMSDFEGTAAPLYQTLLERQILSHDELRKAAAAVSGVPFVVLERDGIAIDALSLIPEPIARIHSVVAFKSAGDSVEVALLDLDALEALHFLTEEKGLRVLPRMTTGDSLKRALILYHKHLKERYGEKIKGGENPDQATDALLAHALLHRASEVHLEPREFLSGQGELLARYRIDGRLYDAMTLPKEASSILSRLKELANLSLTLAMPQEGSFKVRLEGGEETRVRVSTLLAVSGERVVLHLTSPHHADKKGFTLTSLGFHGETLERMHAVLKNKSGLVLISGRAGKTTLAYTLLDLLSHPTRSIVSVERKVEFHLPHIVQTAVRSEIGLDMQASLRALLKQDPDIVLVDAVEDAKSAALALTAASAGKLVLGIVEADSAAEAIEKFFSFGVSPKLFSATLKASIGTAVVGRVCQKCKEEYRLSRIESEPFEAKANFGRILSALKEEGMINQDMQWKDVTFARAAGCSECQDGFKGEIGLQEVLLLDEAIKERILERGGKEEIENTAREGGFLTLTEDGLFKAAQGLTGISEITSI